MRDYFKTYVSPCNRVGYIPVLKNASTSLIQWLSDAGWIEKNLDPNVEYFFVMRNPSDRLLSGLIECIFQTQVNHDISVEKQRKLFHDNKFVFDHHSMFVCEMLYRSDLNFKNIVGFTLGKHLQDLINLFLTDRRIDNIQHPLPMLNKSNEVKTQDMKDLAKEILESQYRRFHIPFDIDCKIYNLIDQTTNFYRLERNYVFNTNKQPIWKKIVDERALQTLLRTVIDTPGVALGKKITVEE